MTPSNSNDGQRQGDNGSNNNGNGNGNGNGNDNGNDSSNDASTTSDSSSDDREAETTFSIGGAAGADPTGSTSSIGPAPSDSSSSSPR